MLRNHGFKIVRVIRPGYVHENGRDPNHKSELEMAGIKVDATIVNDGTLSDLAVYMAHTLGQLGYGV